MAGPREQSCTPDPLLRETYDALHRRHRAVYAALRPLFDSEWAGAPANGSAPATPPSTPKTPGGSDPFNPCAS